MTAPDAGGPQPRARHGVSAALGVLFLVLFAFFERWFPRLPGEFSYVPVLEPLPFAAMRGFTFEQLLQQLGRLALLAPGLALLTLSLRGRVAALTLDARRARRAALLGGVLSVALSAVVLFVVLRGAAITDDELTYRDQAGLLLGGRIADPALPAPGLEAFTVVSRAGLTGKYLFGEPLVQMLGVLAGFPALLHLPLAALALWAWYRVACAGAGPRVGGLAAAALALSPMFVFTNATGLSHTASLTAITLVGLGLVWVRAGRRSAGALLAAHALGFGFVTRPQVAVPMGGVLAWLVARDLVRARAWRALALGAASGAAWLALVAGYDLRTTGVAWRLPWTLYPATETLGWNAAFTPLDALANLAVSAMRFDGWWLGAPLGLALVVLWGVLGRPAAGLRPWLLAGLALLALDFLYYSPGVSDTGPVYYFELLLPASLLAAHAVAAALERWPQAATAALLVELVLGSGSFYVEQTLRLARLRQAIHGRTDAIFARLATPALLLHEARWDEKISAGWVFGFPERRRRDADPIVTFPRHAPEQVRALRERYRERACFYTRVDPESRRTVVARCEHVEALLARPAEPDAEGVGAMPVPTAGRLGLVPVIPGFHR